MLPVPLAASAVARWPSHCMSVGWLRPISVGSTPTAIAAPFVRTAALHRRAHEFSTATRSLVVLPSAAHVLWAGCRTLRRLLAAEAHDACVLRAKLRYPLQVVAEACVARAGWQSDSCGSVRSCFLARGAEAAGSRNCLLAASRRGAYGYGGVAGRVPLMVRVLPAIVAHALPRTARAAAIGSRVAILATLGASEA